MARTQEFGPTNIFQLISDPSEKMKILYDLINARQGLIVKGSENDDAIHVLEPRLIQGSELMCKVSHPENFKFKQGQLIVQFTVNTQKYIAQVPAKKAGEFLALSMEKKLFRVQRREFFRLRLPQTFRGVVQIPELFGSPFNQSFHLVDLSGGGCRVDLPPLDIDIKSGTVFKGILKLPNRPDFAVICTVRYQNQLPDGGWLGLEFFHQSEPEKNRMAATVMDLYRELFSRL